MSNEPANSGDVRLEIAVEIERALGGGATVAVATVMGASEGSGPEAGSKLLVRLDGTSLGALDGDAVDEVVRLAALEQMEALPRVAVRMLWVDGERGVVDRRSQAAETDFRVMLEIFEAPVKLVIVGGGHIGLALAQIGEMLGFEVTVLDDREEFANAERFPMAEHVVTGDLAEGLDALTLDTASYVILVSRGHKQDEEALRHSVGRGAAYVGMIGSRRRTQTVLQHLLDEGFEEEALEAVRTPIGIDIGAETPEEIAVSILAEITLERRGGTGQRMSARRAPLSAS